ncbi:triose-phosphate isomerase [Candidatus Kaiserbacteria bacterium]|nr:triose-phosphate isomerase [Candidatus Kaiserbacteria bacterium]
MKKLLIANWKMNPESIAEAKNLFMDVKKVASRLNGVETVIAPPYIFLAELRRLYTGKRVMFAGQDVFWEEKGAFTGEISPSMLKNIGVSYVIVGHSERRALGESDEIVNQKVLASARAGLRAVVCIGESTRDHTDGAHLIFLAGQVESALAGLGGKMLSRIAIAYEPIWAIGKSAEDAMRPFELHETVLLIRKTLARKYGKAHAMRVPVLYGGSVEKENTLSLLTDGAVNGFLVGHASLSGPKFNDILRVAHSA